MSPKTDDTVSDLNANHVLNSGKKLNPWINNEAGSKTEIQDESIKTASDASETIHNTAGALKAMENNLMEANVNAEASVNLDSTTERLDDASANIEKQAKKNRRLINKGLDIVFSLTVSGVLRLRRTLHLLLVLCWLTTVICWLLFEVYFFLEKFSIDACTALDNFQENSYNNSLRSIIPCDELLSAKPVLFDVSAGIYDLVNKVNATISALQATQYPNLVQVCNPFSEPPSYFYQPENCPANTIRIGDIPEVWAKLSDTELLPGDVVSIGRSSCQNEEEKAVPGDMLVLVGSANVNEVILTGESTPQWKSGDGILFLVRLAWSSLNGTLKKPSIRDVKSGTKYEDV
ncbi:hypothetical protein OROGR_028232 [Orobanche gracilis]